MKSVSYSKEFSDFYDTYAQSDFPIVSERIKNLLNTYNPKGKQLLDLGCGTGKVLEGVPKRYSFTGLDISNHMLEVARKKFSTSKFYLADMSTFHLNKKFDAIICISDAINHLHTFTTWEKTFHTVASHLKKGGVFIFDMNTPIRLKRLSTMPRFVSSMLGRQFFTVKVSHLKKSQYDFSLQIFTLENEKVLVHEESILESSFPLSLVTKSLKKYFSIEEIIDIVRPKVSSLTGKAIFVCKI